MKIQATFSWREALIRLAITLCYMREYAGANDGEGVRYCQRSTGNKPPDYWCMSFVVRVVLQMFGIRCPLKLTGSCEEQRQWAIKKGALRTREQFNALAAQNPDLVFGWIFLQIKLLPDASGALTIRHAHHTGFVGGVLREHTPTEHILGALADGSFYTTEGNASDPKAQSSTNGTGAYTGRKRGTSDDHLLYEFIDLEAF